MHVDGGAREQVFVREFMLLLCEDLKKTGTGRKPDATSPAATVSVIVNGKIGVGRQCVRDCIPDIALRSLSVLLDEALIGNLFRIYATAAAHKIGFRLVSIGLDDLDLGDSYAFDQEVMRKLFEHGKELGAQPDPWKTEPPTAEDIRSLVQP